MEQDGCFLTMIGHHRALLLEASARLLCAKPKGHVPDHVVEALSAAAT